MDYPIEFELLSAIAFEDGALTQQEQQTEHMDDTTTIQDSLPSNNKTEAAISSTDWNFAPVHKLTLKLVSIIH